MVRSELRWSLVCALALAACGSGDGGDADAGDGDGGGPAVTALSISPDAATLVAVDGVADSQVFTVMATWDDGTTEDVTAQASYRVDDVRLGLFADNVFESRAAVAGRTTATATFGGVSADAAITVRVEQTRVDDSAPGDARALFEAATEDPALAPSIVYPDDGTILPPNLGDFEVHWTDASGLDVYEVSMRSDILDLRVYVAGAPNAGSWTSFLPDEWSIAGTASRGAEIAVRVRGLASAAPQSYGVSTIGVQLTEGDIEGGIYYWTTAGAAVGVWRHDMARPGESAEEFYTRNQAPEGRCVGCHALSRDGTRMAVRYDGSKSNIGSVVDVETGTELLATDGTYQWSFAALEPQGKRVLVGRNGSVDLIDVDTGIASNLAWGNATHPDFSPAGDKVVYVAYDSGNDVWLEGGALVVRDYDQATGSFGAPTTVLPAGAQNIYYPHWSPDGAWLIYNQSDGDAYDDADAELYVMKADGTVGPTRLDTPNVADDLTNSWARWAPFEQTTYIGVDDGEPVFWLTWSSKRAFGVRLGAGRPQLWMAPFFPARAAVGADPSGPAFRLPFQDIASSNHIAQWTERVIVTPPVD